jgi:hypothetical protein
MKLLVNDKEIALYLNSLLDPIDCVKHIELGEKNTAEAIGWSLHRKDKTGQIPGKFREKVIEKVTNGVKLDLDEYVKTVTAILTTRKKTYQTNLNKNIDYFLSKFDEQQILDRYRSSSKQYFIKSVGLALDPDAELIRRKYFSNADEDCLLRNTVGNENLLVHKIDNNLPFWFIDSGYTNFIEPNKKWHRVVRNHLHYSNYFDAPSDRLKNLKSFPAEWRTGGDKILIIEPGPFAASIFHVDVKTWKYEVAKELRKYTDKKIYFRPKIDKKIRKDLYKKLLDDDYYCTISINSNSAVESIWAGVPAITLGKHISNLVTVNQLSDINNLYRGPLGNWLSWLTYNQFTYDELMDGTATSIVKKYHV